MFILVSTLYKDQTKVSPVRAFHIPCETLEEAENFSVTRYNALHPEQPPIQNFDELCECLEMSEWHHVVEMESFMDGDAVANAVSTVDVNLLPEGVRNVSRQLLEHWAKLANVERDPSLN